MPVVVTLEPGALVGWGWGLEPSSSGAEEKLVQGLFGIEIVGFYFPGVECKGVVRFN
jgi:hypothetical protein